MPTKNNYFNILIKPCSSDCNLHCDYCFYLKKSKLYPGSNIHKMSSNILERLISTYLNTEQQHYVFLWQGGEPLLMGLDFFKNAINLQQKYGKPGTLITNIIQTNGTLINDDWCKFFNEYKFLVGISIDGPKNLHDIYRKNGDRGSHSTVIKSIRCLQKNQVDFNALVAVHNKNIDYPIKIMKSLVNLNIFYHQYIPIIEFDSHGNPLPWTITGESWGKFLIELFDHWQSKYLKKVSVRIFDSIINYMLNRQKNICSWHQDCSSYYVIEYNGDVYPCDFFVEKSYKLGNISKNNWQYFNKSKIKEQFNKKKSILHKYCNTCSYLQLCMGGCPKYKKYKPINPNNLSWLCKGWKAFLDHSLSKFDTIIKDNLI